MIKRIYLKATFILTAVIAAMVALFCMTSTVAYGATSLGDVVPEINFHYYQNGNEVDGNNLSAGTYDVSIVLSGLEEISDIEFTANYSQNVTVEPTAVSLMSDEVADIHSVGYKLSDGNIVFGFLSDNESASAIDAQGTLIAKVTMTFANDCDAADEISVSKSPYLTFVQVNYADGLDDEYALDIDVADYTGNLFLMLCDVSPAGGHNVSGTIVVATNCKGATNNSAVYGEYTINVYSDAERSNLVASAVSSMSTDANDVRVNEFTIPGLSDGEYYATVSSTYAITREDLIIRVNGADITGAVIPIVACDFDKNGIANGIDAISVYKSASGSGGLYYDLDGNGIVNGLDSVIVYSCSSGTINYENSIIE